MEEINLEQRDEIAYDDARSALSNEEFNWIKKQIHRAEEKGQKYEKASKFNKSLNNNLNLVLLIILALTGGGSLLNNIFNLSWDDPNFGVQITTTALALVAMVLQAIQKVFNSDEKAIKHHETSSAYLNFAREWRLQLITGVDTRKDKCAEALIQCENQISEIETSSLQL